LNDLQRGKGVLIVLLLDALNVGALLLHVVVFVTVALGCGAGLGIRNCACHELGKACCGQNPWGCVGGGDVKSACKCIWLLSGGGCCAT